MLTRTFEVMSNREVNCVYDKTCCQRLFKTTPDQFDPLSEVANPFLLLRDSYSSYPSFEEFLYCSLDLQMVLMYTLWWFFFDMVTDNPMLSVFLTYLIERTLRFIRSTLGEKNLSHKTMIDSRFLN